MQYIESIYSVYIDDLDSYEPENPDVFSYALDIEIGEVGNTGTALFQLQVCTVGWLEDHYSHVGILSGRHILIVFEHDFVRVKKVIFEEFNKVKALPWDKFVEEFTCFAQYEYQDSC